MFNPEKCFSGFTFVCFIIFTMFAFVSNLNAAYEDFYLCSDESGNEYNSAVTFWFDKAGYSDGWYWGYSEDKHEYSRHETLSGEWAAAIYYSGIYNNTSQWLTDFFSYPDWYTYTNFNQDSQYSVWNNYRSARSKVYNSDVNVTIDYNLIDLGEANYSPLSFIDANGNSAYVKSERYICLLTYTIKNIRADHNTIQDLRFFQFLHTHPTGTFSPAEFSSYSTANYPDALKGYDPVYPYKNFRFDITQWGTDPYDSEHVDWIGFSSTVEPNHFDSGDYVGDYYEPETGTHIRIENKSLNDEPSISASGAAGAMEWDLGNLEWNTEKKVTVAVMFGCGSIYYLPVTLTNTDDVNDGNCVEPNDFINYQIYFTTSCDINNVNLIDYLSEYVEFVDANGGGVFSEPNHTVTWTLGNLDTNDSNCFTLKVKVADYAIGGSTISNTVKMYSGDTIIRTAPEFTSVCCLSPVVYVDKNANGVNNGTNWANAYKELRDALADVNAGLHGCANQIWVADGNYAPTDANDPLPYEKPFAMIDGIDIYGHFAGWESSIYQRNLADSNNDTVLTGDIDDDNTNEVQYVVIAADSRLDGFTVKKGYNSGIYCNACSPTIENCVVKYNNYYGISCVNGANTTITNTFISNNSNGIYCNESNPYVNINKCTVSTNTCNFSANFCTADVTDSIFSHANNSYGSICASYANLIIERCDISDNQGRGIGCYNTSVSIKQCNVQRNTSTGIVVGDNDIVMSSIISDNGDQGVNASGNSQIAGNLIYSNASCGIYCGSAAVEIRNNTIVHNGYFGIYSYNDPNIKSNIIWDNTPSGFGDGSFTKLNYNCIQNYTGGGTNINTDPCFVNKDVNDYHLRMNSNCIDRGDPCFNDANLFDIDGEDRIMDGDNNGVFRVDIGADEFCPYDLSQDGFVNFSDFAVFARSWKTSDGNANYNYLCDYFPDSKIDYKDLYIFCDYWLSPSDWADIGGQGAYFADNSGGGEEMMMSMETEQELSMAFEAEQEFMEEPQEDDWSSMLAGEGETASIYLICDVNEPNSGDEVTVQIYSDVPLFCMGVAISVAGDANITGAMSTADCNEYGWDPSWPTDPFFEENGWLYISGIKWESDANGVVGYIKFRYNSGQVSVSITEDCAAYDANCEPVLISGEALTFGESQ